MSHPELNKAFDFVILINLEHYTYVNFMDILKSILGDSYSFARLPLLESNRTLLIVDAYDDRELKYFDQILQGTLIEETTDVRAKILVTTKGAYVNRVTRPHAWFKINGFDVASAKKLFELQGVPNVDVNEIAEMFDV